MLCVLVINVVNIIYVFYKNLFVIVPFSLTPLKVRNNQNNWLTNPTITKNKIKK